MNNSSNQGIWEFIVPKMDKYIKAEDRLNQARLGMTQAQMNLRQSDQDRKKKFGTLAPFARMVSGDAGVLKERKEESAAIFSKREKELASAREELENLVAQHLSETSQDYQKAIKLRQYFERKHLSAFEKRIGEFLKELGQVRGAIASGYDREKKRFSENAYRQFEDTLYAALQLDTAIRAFNQSADAYDEYAKQQDTNAVEFPHIEDRDYRKWIGHLKEMDLVKAMGEFDALIDSIEIIRKKGVAEIAENLGKASAEHEYFIESLVRQSWMFETNKRRNELAQKALEQEES